jgi:hypothetical protein
VSRIAAIEVIPIIGPIPAAGDLDGTTDTVIVRLTDEAGRTGIGETDAPPHVVKAFLDMPTAHLWSRNVSEILIGADPLEATGLWQKLYDGTFWPGRVASASMPSPPSTSRSTTWRASSTTCRPTSCWAGRGATSCAPIAPSSPACRWDGRSRR